MKAMNTQSQKQNKCKNKNTIIEFVRNGRTFSESNTYFTDHRKQENV